LRTYLLLACLASLAACASPTVSSVPESETPLRFDPEEVAYFHETGPASIEGQAVMRREDGALQPCEGGVTLAPGGAFSEQYIQETWGNTESANHNINAHETIIMTPELKAYFDVRRETTCDEEGRFRFEGLADGDYFVFTTVQWWANDFLQGGQLMQRVRIRNGQSEQILMPS